MILIRCDHCKKVTNDQGIPFFQVLKTYRNEYAKLNQRAQRTVDDAEVVKVLEDIKIGDININAQIAPGQELLHVCAGCLGPVAGQGAKGIAHAQVRKEAINALDSNTDISQLSPAAQDMLETYLDFSEEVKQITSGEAKLPDIFKPDKKD